MTTRPAPTNLTRLRDDGRHEVSDRADADAAYGCTRDDWCILTDGHGGPCDEDRESWPGPDTLYPTPTTED